MTPAPFFPFDAGQCSIAGGDYQPSVSATLLVRGESNRAGERRLGIPEGCGVGRPSHSAAVRLKRGFRALQLDQVRG
jgi:hypothetical protein